MPSAIEIERKYDVGEEPVLPVPAGFESEGPEEFRLSAVYLDTADGALARAATALRRREGGHDAGWHLKIPAAVGREEVTAPLSDDLPGELAARIRPLIDGAELSELARFATQRTILVLELGGAAVVELADDRVVAHDVRRGVETRWREWEAELLPGAPESPEERDALLDRVEAALLAAGAVPSASGSKLARALGRDRLG